MSRIGKMPISIVSGVSVSVGNNLTITVKGPKGQLTQAMLEDVAVDVEASEVVVRCTGTTRQAGATHGLMRALIANMVTGVTTGFQKKLEIVGVGYRAEVKGKMLVMQLGYSHPVEFPIPGGIDVTVDKKNNIAVQGIDKQLVMQVAANIRSARKPDHYKGKGVIYQGERVRIKAGKSA
jgi:large subunit ribosomal protein L6